MTGDYVLTLTADEVHLLWLGTETLLEANPDDPDAVSLDAKVGVLIQQISPSAWEQARNREEDL